MDTGKLIMIAIGGFVLYELFLAPVSTAAAANSTTTSTSSTTAPVATGPVVSAQQAQLAQFITALGGQGITTLLVASRQTSTESLTVDQWNYYLNQIAGAQIGPDLTGYVPSTTQGITASQYWSALASYAAGQAPTYASSLTGLGYVADGTHKPAPWHGTQGDGPGRFGSADGDIWGW